MQSLRILYALLIFLFSAYAESEDGLKPIDPSELLKRVKSAENRAVVSELTYDSGRWTEIETGISSGAVEWLLLGKELQRYADGGFSEDLGIALGLAITAQPEVALSILKNERSTDPISLPWTCSSYPFYDDTDSAIKFLTIRQQAVNSVNSSTLQNEKEYCLSGINETLSKLKGLNEK